jgi:hypothetical protein
VSLFATTSRRSHPAAYLRIFLGTLADERRSHSLSPDLRLYVFLAAQHAAQFASNPDQRVPRGWPEAVDLAFEIRDNGQLVDDILELKTENDFAPGLAQRLLRELRHDSAGDCAATAV